MEIDVKRIRITGAPACVIGVVGKTFKGERSTVGEKKSARESNAAVLEFAHKLGRCVVEAGYCLLSGSHIEVDEVSIKREVMEGACSAGGRATLISILNQTDGASVQQRVAEQVRGLSPTVSYTDNDIDYVVYYSNVTPGARNFLTGAVSDGVVAFPGESGTLSEVAFACYFKRPLVFLASYHALANVFRNQSDRDACQSNVAASLSRWKELGGKTEVDIEDVMRALQALFERGPEGIIEVYTPQDAVVALRELMGCHSAGTGGEPRFDNPVLQDLVKPGEPRIDFETLLRDFLDDFATQVKQRAQLQDEQEMRDYRRTSDQKIDDAVTALRTEIASFSATGQPPRLKALLWGIRSYLDNSQQTEYAYTKRSAQKQDSVTSFGENSWKCNKFVADSYASGAGLGLSTQAGQTRGYPANIDQGNKWPPIANSLASTTERLRNLSLGNNMATQPPLLGDIVAFPASVGSGHSSLFLGNGLIISAKVSGIEVGTIAYEQGEHDDISRVRQYTGVA